MIERIEDLAAFESLKEEWDELLEASTSNCLFLTWEWMYTWWRRLSEGRRLFLLTVRDGGQLVAIAPLALRPRGFSRLLPYRSLEFLGTGLVGSDYLDFIIRRGREGLGCHALVDYLADQKLMLELAQVERSASLAVAFMLQLKHRGWAAFRTTTDFCPFINLSGHSWESYLASLGSAHRYNFRRRLKNLHQKFEVGFQRIETEEQRREAVPVLIALHNKRWRDRGGPGAFHTPALHAFHEELTQRALQRGWLRLFLLWLDGEPVASLYGFRYGRVFYFYQSGFDPKYGKHSVGLITMGLAIKSAIEEEAQEYDLLRGDEEYKFHWARDGRELIRLELYPPRLSGLLCKRAAEFRRAAKRTIWRVLPEPLADRIAPGRPIELWKSWKETYAPRLH
jgi:CelD/BcsL family acetyltransferase involved in cellulose biosynthesis